MEVQIEEQKPGTSLMDYCVSYFLVKHMHAQLINQKLY